MTIDWRAIVQLGWHWVVAILVFVAALVSVQHVASHYAAPKPVAFLDNIGKGAGSEAAASVADALKSIRYPSHVEITIDVQYLGEEATK